MNPLNFTPFVSRRETLIRQIRLPLNSPLSNLHFNHFTSVASTETGTIDFINSASLLPKATGMTDVHWNGKNLFLVIRSHKHNCVWLWFHQFYIYLFYSRLTFPFTPNISWHSVTCIIWKLSGKNNKLFTFISCLTDERKKYQKVSIVSVQSTMLLCCKYSPT